MYNPAPIRDDLRYTMPGPAFHLLQEIRQALISTGAPRAPITVATLSRNARIAKNTIRNHLRTLEERQLIVVVRPGPGKPHTLALAESSLTPFLKQDTVGTTGGTNEGRTHHTPPEGGGGGPPVRFADFRKRQQQEELERLNELGIDKDHYFSVSWPERWQLLLEHADARGDPEELPWLKDTTWQPANEEERRWRRHWRQERARRINMKRRLDNEKKEH